MSNYDRPFYIPVILDVSALKETELESLLQSLEQYKPCELTYPSQYALEVAKQLAEKGWPSLARPLPLDLSSTEAIQIFARSLKMFNQFGLVRKEPSAATVTKKVTSTVDFERIVDDLTIQQDGISLSSIFDTARLKSKVYWTSKTTPLNGRISRTVIPVNRVTSKKASEERLTALVTAIDSAILHSVEEETVTFKKLNNPNFQYR